MIYFTSDLHFGHSNILKHQPARNEKFKDIDTMDAALVDGINSVVQKEDTLWILGDVVWKASRAGHYRHRLNARTIHVVYGNHDAHSLATHVSTAGDMAYFRIGQQKFHLTHYPLVSWRGRANGSIHLYGHCHGTMEGELKRIWPDRRAMDISVDNAFYLLGEWRPFSLTEIYQLLGVYNVEIL